ncbi:MAG TPA: type II toxin-antitoxin system HicA family toxin [Rhizomicrobium sp.]
MKLPRDVSGRALAQALIRSWGYRQVNRVGSHMILQTEVPMHHRVSIPDHDPLRIGTLNGILRSVAAAKGVSREQLVSSI